MMGVAVNVDSTMTSAAEAPVDQCPTADRRSSVAAALKINRNKHAALQRHVDKYFTNEFVRKLNDGAVDQFENRTCESNSVSYLDYRAAQGRTFITTLNGPHKCLPRHLLSTQAPVLTADTDPLDTDNHSHGCCSTAKNT